MSAPHPPNTPSDPGSTPLVSIIVPVYNEGKTVRPVIERLMSIELPGTREIVVVDDGSSDNTRDVLQSLQASPSIRIVHEDRNRGKGSAIRTGLQHARGSIVAIQDADLELDPSQLGELVTLVANGAAPVVYGSRFLAGRPEAPWPTIAGNLILTKVTNLLFGAHLTDMETCYKVMRADVARSLALEANRFDIEPEITAKLLLRGYSILERPVRFEARSRAAGKKIRWRDGVHALGVLLKHRLRGAPSDGAHGAVEPTPKDLHR